MLSFTRCISGSHTLFVAPEGGGAGGHPGDPGGLGDPGGPTGTSGSLKNVSFGGDRELISSPPSFSGVFSWG